MTSAPTVVAIDGERGTLHKGSVKGQWELSFGARRFTVPAELLEPQLDGSYLLPLRVADLPGREVIPLVQEQLNVGKRTQERSVTVKKLVREREETVEVPLESDHIEVNRVEVGKPVDGPVEIRTEGDTTIIPVLREQIVVTKQLVLEAEIHVTKRRVSETFEKTLTLKEDEIVVDREDGEATM